MYGVLYVVIELVGQQLRDVGWPHITPLDVATAVTDACLAVALVLAALLAIRLGARRWGGTVRTWWESIGHPEATWDDDEVIGVRSWRPEPADVVVPPAEKPRTGTYAGNPYSFAGHRWPTGPGRRL